MKIVEAGCVTSFSQVGTSSVIFLYYECHTYTYTFQYSVTLANGALFGDPNQWSLKAL
jgi:hypothetical protein